MTSVTHRTSDKRVIRTKKAIKNALFKIMETKDISTITISELTTAANVNRRTFYTHYRCITDILSEIESDLVRELSHILNKFNFAEYKNSMSELFIAFYELVTGEFDFYFHLLKLDTRGLLIARLKNAIKTSSESVFKRNKDGASAKYPLISSFISGGFIAFFTEWYYQENRIPLNEAADLVGSIAECCIQLYKDF